MIKTKTEWEYNSKEGAKGTLYLRATDPVFRTHVPEPRVEYTIEMFIRIPNTNIFHIIQRYSAVYRLSTFMNKYGKSDQGNTLENLFIEADQRLIDEIEWLNSRPESHWSNSIQGKTKFFNWTSEDLEKFTPPEGSQFIVQ